MRRRLSFKKVTSFHPDTLLESGTVVFRILLRYFLVEILRVTASEISTSRKYLVFLTQRGFY